MTQPLEGSFLDEVNIPSSLSPIIPIGDETPKLKGRKRLLQNLQRVTSSQSLARFKSSGHAYRSNGRGSISCITLNSAQSPYSAVASTFGHNLRNGLATAPVTPGRDTPFLHAITSGRFVGPDEVGSPYRTPMSGPVTAGGDLGTFSQEDYFSRPVKIPQSHLPDDFDFWGEMPGELKMNILAFLTPKEIVKCSMVSKTWQNMCFDGQLWANLDTTEYYRKIPAEVLSKIITNAGPFVRDLNLRGCIQLWDSWGHSGLPDACRNLENLSLQDCRLDRSSMHSIICQNPRLVHINLTRLAGVHNSTMRMIAQHCPKLELLNINWCSSVDTRGLRKVIECCSNLRDLRAGEVQGFDDIEFMTELFKCNSLERLLLPNCDSLTDESLSALIEGTNGEIDYLTGRRIVPPRKLKHLDLSRCRNISDVAIKAMINNMPELEGLQLTRCKELTDDSIKPLLASLPSLTHLDLEEVELLTNATLQELSNAPCKHTLQHLSINYCENLGDVGMLPVIKNCTNLKNLDMDNTRISDLCLADAAAMVRQRSLIRPHPLLQRALTWDGTITSKSHSSVTTTPPARPKIGLRMTVFDCQNVTWTGIREVLSRNTEIRRPMPFTLSLPTFANTGSSSSLSTDAQLSSESAIPAFTSATVPAPCHHETNKIISASPSIYPTEIISLKVFYGYQPTVTEHTRRVLRGDFASASKLERKWAEYMVASEEAGAAIGVGTGQGTGNANAMIAGFGTVGSRRRRRRVREAQMMHADEEEGGPGGTSIGRRRRARSGGSGCAVM